MKLSVIVPVFNEENTVLALINRIEAVELDKEVSDKEIIVVNDGSSDNTKHILDTQFSSNGSVKVFHNEVNKGKGNAVRLGLSKVNGDIIIIQDADFEYPPEQYPILIQSIIDGYADVVYGSRFIGTHRVFMFWHYLGNKFLTWLTNILYNTMLTDMETCYKVFTKKSLEGIELKSDRFTIEPELTAKIFKKKDLRVIEVPIQYFGRNYSEGKKITWFDAIPAIWTLFKYRFVN